MKKLVRITSLVIISVMMVVLLASCAPSGKYGDIDGLVGVQYEFKGSKVTIKIKAAVATLSYEGTFKMGKDDNGNKTITFTFGDNGASRYEGAHSFVEGKDDTGKYIKIDGITYYKAK